MHKAIAVIAGVALLVVANVSIFAREKLVTEGRVVLLELAPVDPRSLMQGDYMALRFVAAENAFGGTTTRSDGRLVLKLDERNVGTFSRFDDGSPAGLGEAVMRYRVRNGKPKFGTNAYFFQEGRGEPFTAARFGEFRVAEDGEAILTALRDKALRRLP